MKKFLKNAIALFICVVSLISISGCSCYAPVDTIYIVKARYADENRINNDIRINATIYKKFREPIGTPCYKKTDNGYELINDHEITECYTAEGKKFERANYAKAEKVELAEEFPLEQYNTHEGYTSKNYEIPTNEQYGLIYNFKIIGTSDTPVKIKTFDLDDILGDQIKEDRMVKVTYKTNAQPIVGEDEDYYILNRDDEIEFSIQFQGIKKKDIKYDKIKLRIYIEFC